MRWLSRMVGVLGLAWALPCDADDEIVADLDWRQMAQEEMIRVHSHFDWVGVHIADFDEKMEWPKSSPPYHLEIIQQDDFDIPIVVNREVKEWLTYFLGPGRRTFEIYLARSARYESIIRRELKARGLPQDLLYMAMIESGFVTDAVSGSGASGLWQIMPATAKMFDVRVDGWVDDRLDPTRSTQAAATLLLELKKQWGNWYLAWAAYNGGGRPLKTGFRTTGTKDFWTMSRHGVFASETRNYVPKLIAAAIVGKYRKRYGFDDIKYLPALSLDKIELAGGAGVDVLAECANISEKALSRLNPGLLRGSTPAEGYSLRLPKGKRAEFLSCIEREGLFQSLEFEHHIVRDGQVLSQICERYDVEQHAVLQANGLKDADKIKSGQTLMIPVVASDTLKPKTMSYEVGSGDTLSQISIRHGVTVAQLKNWNGLTNSIIHVGSKMIIGAPASSSEPPVVYEVRAADTLSSIALRYGVTVGKLQIWNHLNHGSVIQVGQALKVILQGGAWSDYTVRDGDSLGKIAHKHSCTVKDLRIWNGLSSTFLRPGQRLRIRD